MYVKEFLFTKILTLHSTAYYRIKNSTTHTSLEVLRKIICSTVSSFSKKTFAKGSLLCNITGLQFRIYDLTKKHSKKNVSCKCSKLVGNLLEEGLYWSHFIKVTGLLSRIYILYKSHPKSLHTFFREHSQNCCFESLGKFPEKRF